MGTNSTRVWCLSSRPSGEGYGLSLYGGAHTSLFTAAYFTAAGNLGIGTASPSYKLEVSGSANATTLYENGNRVITTANIGSQSVSSATSASSVPSLSNSEIDTIIV